MKNRDLRFVVVSWVLFLCMILLVAVWGRYQILALQNRFKQFTISQTVSAESPIGLSKQKTVTVTGPIGAIGLQGTVGTQGIQGQTGAPGIQGPTGLQGTKGDTGATGPSGRNGRSLQFCTLSDGTTGQEYIGDDACQPIPTAD